MTTSTTTTTTITTTTTTSTRRTSKTTMSHSYLRCVLISLEIHQKYKLKSTSTTTTTTTTTTITDSSTQWMISIMHSSFHSYLRGRRKAAETPIGPSLSRASDYTATTRFLSIIT